jgi:gamma-glutamylaminecyclotransferase
MRSRRYTGDTMPAMQKTLIFVYGTLKQGFKNWHLNRGQPLPGPWLTVQAWPLYVIGETALPWLAPVAGHGHRVAGELVAVDDAGLRLMDALEQVDDPGWYQRRSLQVRDPSGAALWAQAYFGCPTRLSTEPILAGPLPAFTATWNARFRETYADFLKGA